MRFRLDTSQAGGSPIPNGRFSDLHQVRFSRANLSLASYAIVPPLLFWNSQANRAFGSFEVLPFQLLSNFGESGLLGPLGTIHQSGLVAQGIERLRPKEGAGGSSPSEAANFDPKSIGSNEHFVRRKPFSTAQLTHLGQIHVRTLRAEITGAILPYEKARLEHATASVTPEYVIIRVDDRCVYFDTESGEYDGVFFDRPIDTSQFGTP